MVFSDESEIERIARQAMEIRNRIIDYIKNNIETPTEENIAHYLKTHSLPHEFYRKACKNKEYLWYVVNSMPISIGKIFENKAKEYYSRKYGLKESNNLEKKKR
ncbi:MAG: hypothetical protein QW041_02925 [Candidatus Pacearchaeota archaeon]